MYRLLQPDVVRPEHKFRKRGIQPIRYIVIHTSEGPWQSGHRWLSDWGARTKKSAAWHAQVGADGYSYQLPDDYQAYHCIGHSANSLGVEQVMYAKQWNESAGEWRQALYENLVELVSKWVMLYDIPIQRPHITDIVWKKVGGVSYRFADKNTIQGGIYAHSDLDLDRKTDPGVGFPWNRFLKDIKERTSMDKPIDEIINEYAVVGDIPPDGWIEEFRKEMEKVDAKPSSLRHVLETHRLLAEGLELSGADSEAISKAILKAIGGKE